jgi:HlyD family secretion protein
VKTTPTMPKNLWNRALWPVLGLGLLAVVVLQARAGQSPAPARQAAATPAPLVSSHVVAEGRVVAYPGGRVEVGTDLAGTLVRVYVHEKQAVRKGEVLAELRSDDHRAALAEARARVAEADAEIRLAESDLERARTLWNEAVGSRQALDRAERDLETAKARRATAAATADRLEAVLAKTRILSPIDGVVISRDAEPGETVEPGAKIASIADLSKLRVEAEVDEFDVSSVKLSAPATIFAEGWNDESWKGKVEEIPDAVVGRRLKPQDPGKPEDTRVLLVKIALLEPTPLKLGQRVEIRIGTP